MTELASGAHFINSKYANNESILNEYNEQRSEEGVEDNAYVSSGSVQLNLLNKHLIRCQPDADNLNVLTSGVSPPSVNTNNAIMLKSVSDGSAVSYYCS